MADQVLTTASGRQVPVGTVGVPGYLSSKLLPSGQGTAEGDVFNQFRGYRGPQGGSFGSYEGPAARSIESQLRDPGSDITSLDDPNVDAKVMRGLVTTGVLNPDGSPTRRTMDLQARTPQAPAVASDAGLDLYGQRDAATSTRPVMKVTDTLDTLRQQARRMATPQLIPPSGTVPPASVPARNVFAQFATPGAPAPVAPAVGTGFAYLPGGVRSTYTQGGHAAAPSPTTEEAGLLGGGATTGAPTLQSAVDTLPPANAGAGGHPPEPSLASEEPGVWRGAAPSLGGMGSRYSMAGPVAAGGTAGSPTGVGSGLRKIGKRNPLMPDSPQNSGLFSGLRKIEDLRRQVQSPTGGAPIAPTLSAY